MKTPQSNIRQILALFPWVVFCLLTQPLALATFEEGQTFFETGDYAFAVAALAEVPGTSENYIEAQALTGRSFDALGMSQLALFSFAEVLKAGATNPHFETAFNSSAALSRFVGESTTFGKAISTLPQDVLPDLERSFGLYAAGVVLLEEDHMKDAISFLSAVPRESPPFIKARLQLARALLLLGERPMAYAVLQDLSINHRGEVADLSDGFGLLTIDMARLSYGMGLYGDAALDYARVPKTSPFWTDALMERSWANFALWQTETDDTALRQSLGALFALTSPALADLYYPEAWLLEAQIFYFLCKPKSGAQVIDDFLAHFEGLHTQLDVGLKSLGDDPLAYYEAALAHRLGAPAKTAIPSPFLSLFLSDPSFDHIESHLAKLSEETAKIHRQKRAWDADLQGSFKAALTAHRKTLKAQRGAIVHRRLKAEYARLGQTIVATQIAQLELITQEMELYQAAAAGLIQERKVKKARWTLPKGRTRTWPFEGEYWLDEVGSYQINTVSQCAAIGQ